MLFISAILLTLNVFAVLPEIQTKQSLNNIRYLSYDGKFTYFQQNGKLYVSTNYSSSIIHTDKKSSSYLIFGTQERKKLVVEIEKDFHRNYNTRKKKELFILPYGSNKMTSIAQGDFLSLNLKDTWINYFNPSENTIYAKSILTKSKEIKIKLKNTVNPFFTPQSLMVSPDTIFFTDINNKGIMALFMYTTTSRSFTPVYRSKFSGMNLKFCHRGDSLYIGEFSYSPVSLGSAIYKIPLYGNKGFTKVSQIYSSSLDDIGNIVCSKESLFFIKTLDQNKNLNSKLTEVAKLDLKNNKIDIITDLKYVTNIINMDGTILVPFREKYFVAQGKSRLNDDKLIEK